MRSKHKYSIQLLQQATLDMPECDIVALQVNGRKY
jgi:hypothetical protein